MDFTSPTLQKHIDSTSCHYIDLELFLDRFQVDLKKGLNDKQVKERRALEGMNVLTPAKPTPGWLLFIQELYSGFGILLWGAAILCFLSWKPLGEPKPSIYNLVLAVVLVFCVSFQSIFSYLQHRHSSNVMASFSKIIPRRTKVFRDYIWKEIEAAELVIGDVVKVETGDKFPADMRIVEAHQAKVEKSSLTGESKPLPLTANPTHQDIHETKNIAFYGTSLLEGSATGVVINTGDRTIMGRIATLTNQKKKTPTTLQKEINHFVLVISTMAFTASVIIILGWQFGIKESHPNFLTISDMIVTIIGVLVAFIPDGLPLSVTMTLTIVAKNMQKIGLLVKKLDVIETLGSSTVIASDKTGTITQNKMSLSHVWCPGTNIFDALSTKKNSETSVDEKRVNLVLGLSSICNNAELGEGSDEIVGSSTDAGLLRGALKYINPIELRKTFDRKSEILFSSRNKYSMTINSILKKEDLISLFSTNDIKLPEDNVDIKDQSSQLYIKILKGAPEIIINHCSTNLVRDADNRFIYQEMTPGDLESTKATAELLASSGERVIGVAFQFINKEAFSKISSKNIDAGVDVEYEEDLISDFCFVGLASMIDPPKPDVEESVEICRRAGIKVAMITGDHPKTAVAIAKMVKMVTAPEVVYYSPQVLASLEGAAPEEVRIENVPNPLLQKEKSLLRRIRDKMCTKTAVYNKSLYPPIDHEAIVVVGADIPNMNKKVWDHVLQHREIVFSRITPEQKLIIVKEFQKRGEIVAVTGDGVNDAPALKCSDIGVAMGNGSDVSKEAAKVVVLNNNFSTIVAGIKQGRLLFDNLQKVTAYLIPAGSFSEIIPVLAYVFLGVPLPLTAFQMIVICVLTDMIGSLGLVNEHPEAGIMERPPRDAKNERMIGKRILIYTYFQVGMLETIIAFFMYFYTMTHYGVSLAGCFFAFDKWGSDIYEGFSVDEQNWILAKGQTAFFLSLVMTQLWNLMAIRTRYDSFLSIPFRKDVIWFMLGEVAIAVLVCYLPPLNDYVGTAPADWYHFVFPLCLGSIVFTLDEIRKRLIKKYPHLKSKIAW